MHIHEIIVDGFKSYAHRTVIAGFDPHFNAITGLNGSGKSNILDSICFVLGITNLSQVRAGNLSELVYKQGQAGISKASVTIVFNNDDTANSPVGYEDCKDVTVTRQVLIGGKSKYLINGRVSPATQVSNLFHSVQLNVNNPHFLIMQGRITKVLNMKPNEILGMVEEAAGTRMYENKRVAALKTIDKKEQKLQEIHSILTEEITPTLERLRGEKQHYLKWSKNKADIERLERFVVASEFVKAHTILQSHQTSIQEMEEGVQENEDKMVQYQQKVHDKEDEIRILSTQLNGEFGESHRQVKQTEEDLSKKLVQTTSAWQNSCNSVAQATDDVKAAKALVTETKEAIVIQEEKIKEDAKRVGNAEEEAYDAGQSLSQLTQEYQNMCAGISSNSGDNEEEDREERGSDGSSMTLPDQISKAHIDANNAEAKSKQATMKMNHLNKTIKTVERDMKKEEQSAKTLSTKKQKATEKVTTLQNQLDTITQNNPNFAPKSYSKLETKVNKLQHHTIPTLQEKVDVLSAQLQGRLAFEYSDPVRGFDRSKVKGMMARLITVHQTQHNTALEVVAGGKLYQVVVDEAITGKALLSRGNLRRRVTIIPLDKITSKRVTDNAVHRARSIASSMEANASPAIELVGFDEEVRNAVEYVFGSTLVVDTMEAANRICDETRTRTVTLDGDVYDPSGTISGGSKNNLGTTLAKLSELTIASNALEEEKKQLSLWTEELDSMRLDSRKYDSTSQKLELASAELSAVEKHLSQTTYGMLLEKFTTMQREIEEAELEADSMKKEREIKLALYTELKDKEDELTLNREAKLREIDESMQQAKKRNVECSEKVRELKSQSQTLLLEMESLKAEMAAAGAAVRSAEKALNAAKEKESELQMKVGDIKAKYDEAKLEVEALEEKMSSCSSELKKLGEEKAVFLKETENAKLEAKKVSIQLTKFRKETANADKVILAMQEKFSWIQSEKDAFGVTGGEYDFEATNPAEMSEQLKLLQSEQSSLAKKINKKVMGMIEKAESEYAELLRKRRVVENDKKKIQSVIEELDEKKKTELQRTWKKVNTDFGSIFSTLLPGASAKLEPPEGMEAWEGLEVKVAFGDEWKQSLSELSGGQRSLLALSLILSMLLFKPAPMYILDEVDAALDLSHTQNIGNMLKTHFSQSQFIVVSLKEGMFNNANVIFRTKFVDGVSTVTRTIGTGASSKARALAEAAGNRQHFPEKTPAKTPSRRRGGLQSMRSRGKENR